MGQQIKLGNILKLISRYSHSGSSKTLNKLTLVDIASVNSNNRFLQIIRYLHLVSRRGELEREATRCTKNTKKSAILLYFSFFNTKASALYIYIYISWNVSIHTETSQLLCKANKLTGFYMRATLGTIGLISLMNCLFKKVNMFSKFIKKMHQNDDIDVITVYLLLALSTLSPQ